MLPPDQRSMANIHVFTMYTHVTLIYVDDSNNKFVKIIMSAMCMKKAVLVYFIINSH